MKNLLTFVIFSLIVFSCKNDPPIPVIEESAEVQKYLEIKEGENIEEVSPDTLESITKDIVEEDQIHKKVIEKEREIKEPIEKIEFIPKKVEKAKITFNEKIYSFGKIVEGDIIEHRFDFLNTGKGDLNIKSAKASCGCTVPSFPFTTIVPGDSGYIGVVYNSIGKFGEQKPEIVIKSDASNQEVVLYLKGEVVEKIDTILK